MGRRILGLVQTLCGNQLSLRELIITEHSYHKNPIFVIPHDGPIPNVYGSRWKLFPSTILGAIMSIRKKNISDITNGNYSSFGPVTSCSRKPQPHNINFYLLGRGLQDCMWVYQYFKNLQPSPFRFRCFFW